jgi:hypothetical protein
MLNKTTWEKNMDNELLSFLFNRYVEDTPEMQEMLHNQGIDINQYLHFLSALIAHMSVKKI